MNIIQLSILFKALRNMAPWYYAVAKGRNPGIYNTWDECKKQVHEHPGSVYKKFSSQVEAENYIREKKNSSRDNNSNIISIVKKRSELKRKEPSEVCKKQPSLKKAILIDIKSIPNSGCNPRNKLSDYVMDDEGYVNVFTDGACAKNGSGNARAGIGVWFGDGHPMNISLPVVGRATNNNAEIQAVTIAARRAKEAGITKLRIYTDSNFVIQCINNWMPKWKTNGWKTMDNKPVINKIELLEMEEALESLNVVWMHVYGHTGIHGNEMADKLAKAACLHY